VAVARRDSRSVTSSPLSGGQLRRGHGHQRGASQFTDRQADLAGLHAPRRQHHRNALHHDHLLSWSRRVHHTGVMPWLRAAGLAVDTTRLDGASSERRAGARRSRGTRPASLKVPGRAQPPTLSSPQAEGRRAGDRCHHAQRGTADGSLAGHAPAQARPRAGRHHDRSHVLVRSWLGCRGPGRRDPCARGRARGSRNPRDAHADGRVERPIGVGAPTRAGDVVAADSGCDAALRPCFDPHARGRGRTGGLWVRELLEHEIDDHVGCRVTQS
jgi:hypothetical protein